MYDVIDIFVILINSRYVQMGILWALVFAWKMLKVPPGLTFSFQSTEIYFIKNCSAHFVCTGACFLKRFGTHNVVR